MIDSSPGKCIIKFCGCDVIKFFEKEAGNHQFQRIPPTEKKGRVQTSLISIAVLPVAKKSNLKIEDKDLIIKTARGSGPGGQHRNKTDSAVLITHSPSGITAYADMKSQHQSRKQAMEVLISRLEQIEKDKARDERVKRREKQVGKGKSRGSKKRTVSEKRKTVVDHQFNKSISYKEYVKGNIEGLHGNKN